MHPHQGPTQILSSQRTTTQTANQRLLESLQSFHPLLHSVEYPPCGDIMEHGQLDSPHAGNLLAPAWPSLFQHSK
jgi:hypothetical protein